MESKEEKFKFNMELLKKNVNSMFQEELKKSDESFKKLQESKLEAYEKRVNTIMTGIKERLLEEVANRANITININRGDNSESINIGVSSTDHPETENVVKSLMNSKKAMLVGPTGTGKTTMVEKITEQLGLPFYKYSCSRDSSVHDLLGYKQPRSEEYLETTFLKAYENGGVFLVDEYDAMSGDMALFFNGVCDNSKFISVPHRDAKPTAEKHKDFYIIMCGNTYGKGSVEYSGRDFQDSALMDRFRMCRHHIGYNPHLERAFMGQSYDWAIKLRKHLESVGSYLSTRNFEEINTLFNNGMSPGYVIKMLISDLEDADKKVVKKGMENVPSTISRGVNRHPGNPDVIVGTHDVFDDSDSLTIF